MCSKVKITIDALMASACPFIYQAVEIDGVPYWDGGYMGNPLDLAADLRYGLPGCDAGADQSLQRKGTPKHAIDIINRVNEIQLQLQPDCRDAGDR